MLRSRFEHVRSILCLGAHADDIEIGCGAAVARLCAEHPGLEARWVVFSGAPRRQDEARASAETALRQAARRRIDLHDFPDAMFPWRGEEIKGVMRALAAETQPDLIFTHRREDLHQDHRLLAELTWNVFRHHLIWEYEIPKYEGDLGHPNVFVALSRAEAQAKVEHVWSAFPSQQEKAWFSRDTFWALLRLRGLECAAPEQLAEAFYCRKATY